MAGHGKQRVVILGGGYAGLMAAARVVHAGSRAEVTLVDARPEFVQRIRLHELLTGRRPATLPYAPLLERRGVRFVQGWVERLEPEQGQVVGRDAAGGRFELRYDELILALGSQVRARVPGVAEHALRLNQPDEIMAAGSRLPELAAAGGRLLVVGGGLTGIEAAAEVAERYPGLRVTLVTSGSLGEGFSSSAEAYFRRCFSALGVEVREGLSIAALEASEAHASGGERLPFDMCVWNGGCEVPALAREAGLAVNPEGRVKLDSTLRSQSHPNIHGAGDAALATVGGFSIRMGCVSALPTGVHAGENVRRVLQGQRAQPFDFGFQGRCISLGRRDGLIQMTDTTDNPRDTVWTGIPAVVTKELIGQMTYWVPRTELSTGLRLYRWPHSEHSAAAHRSSDLAKEPVP